MPPAGFYSDNRAFVDTPHPHHAAAHETQENVRGRRDNLRLGRARGLPHRLPQAQAGAHKACAGGGCAEGARGEDPRAQKGTARVRQLGVAEALGQAWVCWTCADVGFGGQLREQRKVDLEKHVQEVNALLRKANEDLEDGSDNGGEGGSNDEGEAKEEWDGFDEPLAVHREDEYIDEDKYTTVTVESVDISKDGFHRVGNEGASENSSDEQPNHKAATNSPEPTSKRRVWTKEKPVNAKPKKKKKKFRYEGKAERKVTRTKERSKSRDQAKARRS